MRCYESVNGDDRCLVKAQASLIGLGTLAAGRKAEDLGAMPLAAVRGRKNESHNLPAADDEALEAQRYDLC